jgi:hypothetical protein
MIIGELGSQVANNMTMQLTPSVEYGRKKGLRATNLSTGTKVEAVKNVRKPTESLIE